MIYACDSEVCRSYNSVKRAVAEWCTVALAPGLGSQPADLF